MNRYAQLLCLLLVGSVPSVNAQVFADILLSSGECAAPLAPPGCVAAIDNPGNCIDGNLSTYTELSKSASGTDTAFVHVAWSTPGQGGDFVGIVLQSDEDTLAATTGDTIVIQLFNSNGDLLQTLDLFGNEALNNNFVREVRTIGFYTPLTATDIASARIMLAGNFVETDLRIYGAYYQSYCPIRRAVGPVVAAGPCVPVTAVFCPVGVNSPGNSVDGNDGSIATMQRTTGALPTDFAYLTMDLSPRGRMGDFVGFVLEQAGAIRITDAIQAVTIKALDATGAVLDQEDRFSAADIIQYETNTNRYVLGFTTAPGSTPIDSIRIEFDSIPNAQLGIVFGFTRSTRDIPATITPDGPTSFCSGDSVVLQATPTDLTTNWSTGSTDTSITVYTSGTWYVSISDSQNCVGVDSITTTEFIIAPPTITTAGNGFVCGSESEELSADTGYTGYAWSTGDSTRTITATGPGTYYVTVTDTSGCTAVDSFTLLFANLQQGGLTGIITPATCNNTNDGEIDLTVTSGSGSYNYQWNHGATTQDIVKLAPGYYSVLVTDLVTGCKAAKAFTVSHTYDLGIAYHTTTARCGVADGFIDITVTGGTGNYSYFWSNNIATEDNSNLPSGLYTVTVSDAGGCLLVQDIPLSNTNCPLVAANIVKASCGQNNGSLTAVATGGTGGPYSFLWDDGTTTAFNDSLFAGTYHVVVTDIPSGCQTVSAFKVTENNNLQTVSSITNETCGQENGQIDLSVFGGSGNYVYSWAHGPTTQDVQTLSAGVYEVTVTDLTTGCSIRERNDISQIGGPSVVGLETHISCHGLQDGAIDVSASGSTPNLTYVWSHGPGTQDVTNLRAGRFTVSVVDTFGCIGVESFIINEPTPVIFKAKLVDPFCNGASDGRIDVSVQGGSPAYTYSWSTGATTQDLNGVPADTFDYTLTDFKGCSYNAQYILVDRPALVVNANITDADCLGGSSGAVDVTVTGGLQPYDYAWSTGATTQDISGLMAGAYILTVTDSNNCQQIDTFVVREQESDIHMAVAISNITCTGINNGVVDITVTGGSGPTSFIYSWSNGAVSQDISGLGTGYYYVTVTDTVTGCSDIRGYTVTRNDLSIASSVIAADCGESNGEICLAVNGGSGGYRYFWPGGGSITECIANLPAGDYTVTVEDTLLGCSQSKLVTIDEDDGPALTAAITRVTACNTANGAIVLTASGGSGNYTYKWSTGATTKNVTGLMRGTYVVTVVDTSLMCTTVEQFDVELDTSSALVLAAIERPANCGVNDGAIDLVVTGGSGFYSYQWSDGQTIEDPVGLVAGSYRVTVTDVNTACQKILLTTVSNTGGPSLTIDVFDMTCAGLDNGAVDVEATSGSGFYTYEWSHGPRTQDISGLANGEYIVRVEDTVFDCISFGKASITEPKPIELHFVSRDLLCHGDGNGSIDLSVRGGRAPYNYQWSNSALTQDINGLSGGVYTVLVTGQRNCTRSMAVPIVEPTELILTLEDILDPSCAGVADGFIEVSAGGATPPYSYTLNAAMTNTTGLFTALPAADHSVQVMDGNGCTVTTIYPLVNKNLTVDAIVTPVLCPGDENGAVDISVSGSSVGSFNYSWSNGETTQDVSDLGPGLISVHVTDNLSTCTVTKTFTLEEPVLNTSFVVHNTECGNNTGAIFTTVKGGFDQYAYLWSNSSTDADQFNLAAGNYSVTVRDLTTGCVVSDIVSVQNTDGPSVTPQVTRTGCGLATGGVTPVVSGGQAPYEYQWSTGSSAKSIGSLPAGDYRLTVTDARGCKTHSFATVTDLNNMAASKGVTDATCGNADGAINLSILGGSGSYSAVWSNGSTSFNLNNLRSGVYAVTVNDNNSGCVLHDFVRVNNDAVHFIEKLTEDIETCRGDYDAFVRTAARNGSGNYSYRWSNGDNIPHLFNVTHGHYFLEVTDNDENCTVIRDFKIKETLPFDVHLDAWHIGCPPDGRDFGKIQVYPSGNQAPYAFAWSTGGVGSVEDFLPAGPHDVTVTDASGCAKSTQKVIDEEFCPQFVVSEIVSPNGDGANDFWEIQGVEYFPFNDVVVVNRWGDVVFEAVQYDNSWDGTNSKTGEPVLDGTYFWVFRSNDATSFEQRGFVKVIRN